MSELLPITELFSSIQGEGYLAGRRQIFIRLAECNLSCDYCDTDISAESIRRIEKSPGSGVFERISSPVESSHLLNTVHEWNEKLPHAHHSISLTGGEPLLHSSILVDRLHELRSILPLHLETNGALPDALRLIVDQLDFISMDIKLPSTAGSEIDLWNSHRAFLEIAATRNVSVKIVVGDSSSVEEIERVCEIITKVRPETPLFIQPLTPSGVRCGINAAHLLRLQARAAALLPDVRVIPQMHKLMGVL